MKYSLKELEILRTYAYFKIPFPSAGYSQRDRDATAEDMLRTFLQNGTTVDDVKHEIIFMKNSDKKWDDLLKIIEDI